MVDINLLYRLNDTLELHNNIFHHDQLEHERSFVKKEAWMPSFLSSLNINYSVNERFQKGIFPLEFRLYSPTWEVDLPNLDFLKDKDFDFLVWHPRQGYQLPLSSDNIFNILNQKFPNNKIKFTFGAINRPNNLPHFVNYYQFDYFQWQTTTNVQRPILNKFKESSKEFLILAGRFRPQRAIIYFDLLSSGYLSNATHTFNGYTLYNESYEQQMLWIKDNSMDLDIEFYNKILSQNFLKWLNSFTDTKIVHLPSQPMFDENLYNNVYLDLITETYFDSRTNCFITEKTYRSIANGCIFLICGQSGTIAYLKKQGFQTFDDLFDESYDSINSWSERWTIIRKNLDLWLSMSTTDKKEYYRKSFDKLIYNQELLYNRNHKDDVLKIFTD